MQSQVTEKLVAEFLRILETQGRDWHRVRWAIHGLEREIKRSAQGGDPWDEELANYLETRVVEALVLARDEAVAAEEFEWAHEITIRLHELGWQEEPVDA
jgi:hypothetical protein